MDEETAGRIERLRARGFRLQDLHVHLKGGLTLDQALERSRACGIEFGIAVNCGRGFPVERDEDALAFCAEVRAKGALAGMQAEGREWTQMFSQEAAAAFDYIFTDAMTWSDADGRRMRLWIAEEVGEIADAQGFMETLVERTVGILEREPIDIYVNPTFLPTVLAAEYDRLWTDARMDRVIGAAARNGIAIELNDLYGLPSGRFVRRAKAAGCRFTLGTNNTGREDLGCSAYGLRMIEECGLGPGDFFVPGGSGEKAAVRKATAFLK